MKAIEHYAEGMNFLDNASKERTHGAELEAQTSAAIAIAHFTAAQAAAAISTRFRDPMDDIRAMEEDARTEAARQAVPEPTCEHLPAPNGCDDCSVEPGESHRYAKCPGNQRARARRDRPGGLA
jgi:hypothetical protein